MEVSKRGVSAFAPCIRIIEVLRNSACVFGGVFLGGGEEGNSLCMI